MLELILGLWLFFGAIFYFIKSIPFLIQIAFYVLFSPVLPFYIAFKNKKENPIMSKLIYWLWGAFYFLMFIVFFFNYIN